MAQGKPCPVTKETAFQVLKGMSYEQYLDSQAEVARKVPGYTGTTDINAVQLVSLAGACGDNGPEGRAVVVGTTRAIIRHDRQSVVSGKSGSVTVNLRGRRNLK